MERRSFVLRGRDGRSEEEEEASMLHNFPEIINAAATDGSSHFGLGRRDGENGCVSELISGPFPSQVE